MVGSAVFAGLSCWRAHTVGASTPSKVAPVSTTAIRRRVAMRVTELGIEVIVPPSSWTAISILQNIARVMTSSFSARRRPSASGEELDAVPPRVVHEEPRDARRLGGIRPGGRHPSLLEARRETLELLDGRDPQRRMRLGGCGEVVRHAYVQLLLADPEPHAAARREQRRLVDLREAEQLPVEPARGLLATRRRRDLDMVEPDDRRHRPAGGAPRDPGPE